MERVRVHRRPPPLQRKLTITKPRSSAILTAVVAFTATAAGLVLLFPLLKFFVVASRHVLLSGDGGDDWLYLFYVDVGLAKLSGVDPRSWFDAGYFFPTHAHSLLFTEHHLGFTALLLPFMDLVPDPIQRISVGTVLAIIGGLVGTFAWARHLGADRFASLTATLAFAGSGGFLALMPRPFFWAIGWVPVVAILAVRTARVPSIGRAVALGLAAGWLGWCSSHLAVMGGVFAALSVASVLFVETQELDLGRRRIIAFATAGVLAALLVAPFAIPQAETLFGNGFDRSLSEQARDVPSPLGLVGTPWMATRRWAESAFGIAPAGGEVFAGMSPWVALTLLVAAAVGLARLPRRDGGRPWVLAGVAAAIGAGFPRLLPDTLAGVRIDTATTAWTYAIALPVLVLGARRLRLAITRPFGAAALATAALAMMTLGPMVATADGGVPTPALLLCRLPGLSAIRLSARWGIVMNVAAAGAFALALTSIESRGRRVVSTALLCLLVARDIVQPNHFGDTFPVPPAPPLEERPVDKILRELPNPGAVMELPWLDGPKEVPRMMSIRRHGRPLVNGYAGMVPAFFAYHAAEAAPAFIEGRGPTDAERAHLRAFGARYWVVHLDRLAPSAHASWKSLPGLPVVATCDEGRTLVIEDPAPAVDTSALPTRR